MWSGAVLKRAENGELCGLPVEDVLAVWGRNCRRLAPATRAGPSAAKENDQTEGSPPKERSLNIQRAEVSTDEKEYPENTKTHAEQEENCTRAPGETRTRNLQINSPGLYTA